MNRIHRRGAENKIKTLRPLRLCGESIEVFMPYPMFDRSRLCVKPLAERVHDMKLADVLALDAAVPECNDLQLLHIAERITRARENRKCNRHGRRGR